VRRNNDSGALVCEKAALKTERGGERKGRQKKTRNVFVRRFGGGGQWQVLEKKIRSGKRTVGNVSLLVSG